MLHGNAGLLRFSQQDYSGALEEFEAAAAADPADSAAVNNAAICQLLSTQVRRPPAAGCCCVSPVCGNRAWISCSGCVAQSAAWGRPVLRHPAEVQFWICACAGAQRCARAADGRAGAANAASDAGLRVYAGSTV